ncbi:hypothetical protein [Streptomyces sp. NPDC058542]|uniref:hypothetical protein n=1 Tax=Streptomyces sp. NPDC058542 TaxID=3346543 RepID=UPI00366044AE
MLSIDFTPELGSDTPPELESAALRGKIDWAELSTLFLRYTYFIYPVTLTVDDTEIISHNRLPLIDFMFCLAYSVEELRGTGKGEISFTEGSSEIHISLKDDRLIFSPTWSEPVNASCGVEEYDRTVSRFILSGIQMIVDRYPEMENNPAIRELRNAAL